MQVVGTTAGGARAVVQALQATACRGRAAFVWCDGDEVTGVFADEGDRVEDVLKVAAKVLPDGMRS